MIEEAGGFEESICPGEDTLLGLLITRQLGKKIVYDPEVVVYHHRRPLFVPHLRQVSSYAYAAGYLARYHGLLISSIWHLVPSLLVMGLVLGAICASFVPFLAIAYLGVLFFYIGCAAIAALRSGNMRLAWMVFIGIVLTNICYGISFIRAIVTGRKMVIK